MKTSFLVNLTCSNCGKSFAAEEAQTFCADCNSPLVANYDLNSARARISTATN